MKETIIQFGEGNFLRGFVDYFIHMLNEKNLYDGKAVIVQPIENGLADVVNEQNGIYNLFLRGIENGEEKTEHTKITSVSRAINPYKDFDSFIKLAYNPEIRFVISNTTEAGIAYDESCTLFDKPPSSFPAKVTVLLYERFKAKLPGFVFFCCELIDCNAYFLKKYVLQYAKEWQLSEEFICYIETQNTFCNTLVDRIVTGYPKDEAEKLCEKIGYNDKLLDTAEIFHLWVIEGDYESELPLQKAGYNVVWTKDVAPYKKRKVRILNGAHTSMVPCAVLMGLETVGECMNNETVSTFLKGCLFEEIVPTLGSTEADISFANAVLDRFANPYIKHQLRSIALNSVSKYSVRVLPTVLEYKKQKGTYPKRLVFALAAWILFYQTDKPEDSPECVKGMKRKNIADILKDGSLWGQDISELYSLVTEIIEYIKKYGIKKAIEWTAY